MKANEIIDGVCSKIKAERDYTAYKSVQLKAKDYMLKMQIDNMSDSKAVQKITVNEIYPVIGLYRAMMEDGFGEEETMTRLENGFKACAAADAEALGKKAKFLGAYKKFPKNMKASCSAEFGPDAGFEYNWPADCSDTNFHTNVTKCLYKTTCEKFGYPQLTKLFCLLSKETYNNAHPALAFSCVKSMGNGDDVCDIEYKLK